MCYLRWQKVTHIKCFINTWVCRSGWALQYFNRMYTNIPEKSIHSFMNRQRYHRSRLFQNIFLSATRASMFCSRLFHLSISYPSTEFVFFKILLKFLNWKIIKETVLITINFFAYYAAIFQRILLWKV